MTDRVIVKGWRARQEEARAELRDRLWTSSEVVGVRYDDQLQYQGVSMALNPVIQHELRRLSYKAQWQKRKDDPVYRQQQKEWHARWRVLNREKLASWNKSYSTKHLETGRSKSARYKAKNPHQSAIYMQLVRLAGLVDY